MESRKDAIVPINFKGEWMNFEDGEWRFQGQKHSYIKVPLASTFDELVEIVYNATSMRRGVDEIEIHAWDLFPNKQFMPPWEIRQDMDVSTYIELSSRRNEMMPLCITNIAKGKATKQLDVRNEDVRELVDKELKVNSQSVNQQEGDNHQQLHEVFPPTCGLDDIKLTGGTDGDNDSVYEDTSSDDEMFQYEAPYDYRKHEPGVEGSMCQSLYDSHFGVFLESEVHTELEKDRESEIDAATSYEVPPTEPKAEISNCHLKPEASINTGNDDSLMHIEDFTNDAVSLESSNVHTFNDFKLHDIFLDKESIMIRLRMVNLRANREFHITHSDRKRVRVRCIDSGCKWSLLAVNVKDAGVWSINKYVKEHTCSIDLRVKERRGSASALVIAHMVKNDGMSPTNIKEMLQRVYGVNITYWKAWKSKEVALQLLRGLPEDSFKGLASYLWLIERYNPGTHTKYELDSDGRFVQCFISYGASIAGFRSCIRPVIAVDACHLKGRYKGKLFLATAMDGNQQIYPIAYAVAPTENDVHWSWFFHRLEHVVGQRDDLVIISDRMPSIEKACREVFPYAVYGVCMFHLGLNMSHRFHVKAELFLYGAAKAYTEHDFEHRMRRIRSVNRPVYDYLMEADPSKWARCFFPARRYSIMTTNIAESMNAVLKEAREFPIIGMLETIRLLLQTWFYNRNTLAQNCTSTLTPKVEAVLSGRDDEARHYVANSISQQRFHILDGHLNGDVDLNSRTCTCNVFQKDQLPCRHALRACRERKVSMYSLCSRYYTTEFWRLAYAIPIIPVPHRDEWDRLVPDEVKNVEVKPPQMRPRPGRPQNKRILSQGEEPQRRRQCTLCKQGGHNKQTCKGYVHVHANDKAPM